MKIIVKAKPGSHQEKVEKLDSSNYIVWVKDPAREGRANAAIIRMLARYFNVSPVFVEIISGYRARTKVILIHQDNRTAGWDG